METKELLLKSANEMFLQGELPQDFIAKQLPIDLLKRLIVAIYLDLNIVLPVEMEDDVRQTLILIAVLFTAESELSETDEPNVYRMYLKVHIPANMCQLNRSICASVNAHKF
jgi:hypothetical protein